MLRKVNLYAGGLVVTLWISSFIASFFSDEKIDSELIFLIGMGFFIVVFIPVYFIYHYRKDTFPPPAASTALSAIFSLVMAILAGIQGTSATFGGPSFWGSIIYFALCILFLSGMKPEKKYWILFGAMFLFFTAALLPITLLAGIL